MTNDLSACSIRTKTLLCRCFPITLLTIIATETLPQWMGLLVLFPPKTSNLLSRESNLALQLISMLRSMISHQVASHTARCPNWFFVVKTFQNLWSGNDPSRHTILVKETCCFKKQLTIDLVISLLHISHCYTLTSSIIFFSLFCIIVSTLSGSKCWMGSIICFGFKNVMPAFWSVISLIPK